jgi:ferritin-like protein
MMRRINITFISAVTILMLLYVSSSAISEDIVYGYQLMTEQERAEHRSTMRSFNTEAEREAYRRQHHEMMQQRAREQGVTLPDEPMPRGQGRGMGKGQGYRGGQGQNQDSKTDQ